MKCFEQKFVNKVIKIPSEKHNFQYLFYDEYDGISLYSVREWNEFKNQSGEKYKFVNSVRDFIK
jgi:hypothetical protein